LLASVNGQPIHLSDLQAAAGNLPAQMQQLPPNQLLPLLLNQLIDRKALLVAAQAANLQKNPQVAAAMADAADEKLENAYVQVQVSPVVTDAAVQAAYKANYAGKPGPEQVDARHILVKTQAEAQAIITQLNHGANFAKLAQKYSIDPGAANGGELGWFTQDQMVPVFANAAFALKPGEYTKTPVQSQFGWHVILSEGKRTAPPQTFDQVKDQIRQKLADDAIKATLADARSKVTIQTYNADGTPATPDQSEGGVNVNLNPNAP
jgi:peptidyl-prolyl cis-trans isomerase C